CLTPICIKEASRILRSLDETVDPCDDFYQFSCGQWLSRTPIPDHKSAVNSFANLQDIINYRIKQMIDNIDTLIEQRGDQPLRQLLYQLIDSRQWPLMSVSGAPVDKNNNNNNTNNNWLDLYLKLKSMGLANNMLFSLTLSTDIKNNTKKVLMLDQPTFGTNRDSLLATAGYPDTDRTFTAYRDLLRKSGQQLWLPSKMSANQTIIYEINETIDSIVNFERLLANISMSNEFYRHENLTVIIYEDMDVDTNTNNNNNDLNNDQSLDSSLFREERDYLKLLINYILWRVILTKHMSLDSHWRHMRQEYDDYRLSGSSRRSAPAAAARPRWQQCVKTVENSLHFALSHLYIKQYANNDDIREQATKLIETVRSKFRYTLLNNMSWIDNKTMIRALDKLDKMRILVGYPMDILDDQKINQLYKNININPDDFFGNILAINYWKLNQSFNSSLRKFNDIHSWQRLGSLTLANAFYNTVKNMVTIPVGILQGVFYDKDRPNYLNYGALAKTAGHEIIHGFDSHGRHFDGNGNVNYWWLAATDRRYRQKAQCFIRQYGDYYVGGDIQLSVNGQRTQAENIADNGGIKLAFRAYRQWLMRTGSRQQQEPLLPALNYTGEQLFWISYGVHYCSKHNRDSLRNLLLKDSHTPKKYRINGALSNSPEFSETFNCPQGSPMNPINKCSLW
ncbi:neprilysin-2-like, partial [Oppia nitens]|uniref:neprilysin-2-like n=1 Tax=Oppia nitens TaxID=1686743 RepID=UPI0023DAC5E3